jgi:D-serine deaminase-like pyridoxal phosphate-dependent protein
MTSIAELDPRDYDLPVEVVAGVITPALVIHLDRVRSNIARIVRLLGGEPGRWRPHLKTTKMPEIWAELLKAGVRPFKCATTREAAVMLELLDAQLEVEGDLLVAYPMLGPALARLGALAEAHPGQHVSVLCEDLDVLRTLPSRLGVFVDVNPGMNRTGVPLSDRARILALARAAGPRFAGLHHYEGHLHDADLEVRSRRAFAGYEQVAERIRALDAAGIRTPELVTSGTPGLLCALAWPHFDELGVCTHRVSPGTVVFHDLRSEQETPELGLTPAATVLTRVVSHPGDGMVTCDAGSKALASEAGDPVAFVLGRPDLVATTPSEEHLPLRASGDDLPARGSLLHLVPKHVCPTVNLADRALLIEAGCAPRWVPVLARGHEIGADLPSVLRTH